MNEAPRPESERSNLPGQQPGLGFYMPPPPSHPPQPPVAPGFGYVPQPVPAVPASAFLDMPQRVKAARIVLFLLAGFLIIAALAALAEADAAQNTFERYSEVPGLMPSVLYAAQQKAVVQTSVAQTGLAWGAVYAALALVLAARFGKGGNALRIGTIVYGAWLCVVSVFALALTADVAPTATVIGDVTELAAGILLIVLMVQREGIDWFSRVRT
ncbi:hypothetical protein GCM10010095_70920 [Streptomyces anthocyanicus]|uniref:Uncharacterized protein n=2 Tax=Streptomyces violaceoruber group TaxID=2867121 RepID=A0A6G3TF56_9ACTN|nr:MULTISPECIES: hypothetical protein [Streptomyces anthocyanicus group]NEC35330.1 hypothetical protein [Streptomyces rubrogriseus]WSB66446.1 hypothetical protein OIE72_39585 [Streptomyces anthocyanicus]GGL75711.1 hypothetical protein GCM10010095_70920 [Streptomyces anthocyanicus]